VLPVFLFLFIDKNFDPAELFSLYFLTPLLYVFVSLSPRLSLGLSTAVRATRVPPLISDLTLSGEISFQRGLSGRFSTRPRSSPFYSPLRLRWIVDVSRSVGAYSLHCIARSRLFYLIFRLRGFFPDCPFSLIPSHAVIARGGTPLE